MKKEETQIVNKWKRENDVDDRTLPLVVHHYITIGERAVNNLTTSIILDIYDKEVEREKEAAKEGKVLLLSPDFQKYLLTACKALYDLGAPLRYKIIAGVLK